MRKAGYLHPTVALVYPRTSPWTLGPQALSLGPPPLHPLIASGMA